MYNKRIEKDTTKYFTIDKWKNDKKVTTNINIIYERREQYD
ncbi:MAG: hypothetical protein RRY78_01005 [Clostridia bacterium]